MSLTAEQKEGVEILVKICKCCKDPPSVTQLMKDFIELERKPLNTTGFRSLPELLQASNKFDLINRGNDIFVNLRSESPQYGNDKSYKKKNRDSVPSKTNPYIAAQRKKPTQSNRTNSNYIRPLQTGSIQMVPFVQTVPYYGNNKTGTPQYPQISNPELLQQMHTPQYPHSKPIYSQYPKQFPITKNHVKSFAKNDQHMNIQPITARSPVMMKPSVQDRLANIKRSVSKEETIPTTIDNNNVKNKHNLLSKDIPLEWWATENMSVIDRLEQYCILKQLPPPNYTYFKVKEGKLYKVQCRVTIEDTTYSTYPEDFDTKEQARIVCAAKAVDGIKLKQENTQYPPFQGDRHDLACKIYEIVNSHKTGVILKEIPNLFRSSYNFTISSDFHNIIKNEYVDFFIVEQSVDQEIVFANENAILSRFNSEISVTPTSDDENPNLHPPQIELPWDQKAWNILITLPESTAIWCNLLGPEFYEARVALYDEIELSGVTDHPQEILINAYYIAIVHQCPHRIKAIEQKTDKSKILCLFIDTGEQEWLETDQLYICDAKFLQLPAQAIPLSLEGLHVFNSLSNIEHAFMDLYEKVLVAKIHTTEEQYRRNKKFIEVTLFDTSTEYDVNINDNILQKIMENVIKPTKLNVGCNFMIITNVSDSGIITGYLKGDGYMNLIKQEIKRLVLDEGRLQECSIAISDVDENELYLVYDKTLAQFIRVKVLSKNNDDEITVHLIDYGTDSVITKSELYRLAILSKALQVLPAQAIQMKLYNVNTSVGKDSVSLLRGLLNSNKTCLVKVNEFTKDLSESALVTIYFRASNGVLQCANDAVSTQTRLTSLGSSDDLETQLSSDINSNEYSFKKIDETHKNIPQLPTARIPLVKEKFSVRVILSQSPKMFFIQPLDMQKKFETLVNKMQKYYETMKDPLDPVTIKEHYLYAAYRESTKEWCRAKLLNRYSEDCNKVYFPDYANIDVVSIKNLRELPNEFRELPEQAVQAKLYGIKSKSNSGYSSEAAHRFIELTKNKTFESIVMGVDAIPDSYDRVVNLDLIERNLDDNDPVFIREILIMEQLAVPCPEESTK
uniref:CSON004633 protein n=1 Tax=Culicoides sonorensis TaxID=179676 RepID=A0A336MTU0_CULSO